MSRDRIPERLLVALFAAIVIFQLFIPPSIGLASNGDFSKMIGRFALAPESLDTSEEYRYFTAHWVYDRSFLWVSDDRSSELIPITAAVMIGWWFSNRDFDIRILGAIHALLWIGCFAAFLPLLRGLTGWRWYLASIAALFIFTDVSYIAHCNSFYTDVAAFLFLAWALVLWLHVLSGSPQSFRLFVLYAAASVLCVSSKAQHAPLGLFLGALAYLGIPSFQGRWRKFAAFSLPVLIVLAAALSFQLMPHSEKGSNEYHVIFMSILHKSPTPVDDLRELGLGPEYLRYVDRWPDATFDPLANPAWRAEFSSRTSYGRIALFHLRHPWRTLAIIYRDLHYKAKVRRVVGNYQRADGFPPGAQTRSFGWWSALRSALFRVVPWHIVVWYTAVLAWGIWFAVRRRATLLSRIGLFAVLLAGMGLVELVISSLTDTGETERHLFLFHVITDFTMMLALIAAAWFFQGRASLRAKS